MSLLDLIEEQLSSTITGIELNEGFGLFVVAGRTHLSARLAQRVLRERLPMAAHGEFAPGVAAEQLSRILSATPRPTVVRMAAKDAAAVDAWRPVFRRLNENRNAIARTHDSTLVLIVAEDQTEALAAEAPDLWSVAIIRVVGWLGRVELLHEMARRHRVLEALTTSDAALVRDALRERGLAELMDGLDADRRARQAFEVLLGNWRESARREVAGLDDWEFEMGEDSHCHCLVEGSMDGDSYLWDVAMDLESLTVDGMGLGWYDQAPSDLEGMSIYGNHGIALLPSMPPTAALARMLDVRQALTGIDTRICVAAAGMLAPPLGEFVRRTFDLVFEIPAANDPASPWQLQPGTAELAPLIRCPRGIEIRIDGTRAQFALKYPPIELGDPTQLWLPGFDVKSLGDVPLRG